MFLMILPSVTLEQTTRCGGTNTPKKGAIFGCREGSFILVHLVYILIGSLLTFPVVIIIIFALSPPIIPIDKVTGLDHSADPLTFLVLPK